MIEGIRNERISKLQLDLGRLKLEEQQATLLEVNYSGVTHYVLYYYRSDSDKCVVFGTGAINKKKIQIPHFDRLSWHTQLPCNSIYYFDSTLYLNESLNLGWLYGTNRRWYMEEVESIVLKILKKMRVGLNDTVFVGSSGGGFTSMAMAAHLHSRALVYNPQLICRKWSKPHIERLECVLEEGEELLEERLNLNRVIENSRYCPELRIVQNVYAEDDIINQIVPFMKDLSPEYHLGNRVRFDFYSNTLGHNGMVDNVRTQEMILEELGLK